MILHVPNARMRARRVLTYEVHNGAGGGCGGEDRCESEELHAERRREDEAVHPVRHVE